MKKRLAAWLTHWLPEKFAPYMDKRGSAAYIGRTDDNGVENPYLDRYFVFRLSWVSVFVHRFWQSDEAGLHCHPWDNVSIPLVGGYWEDHHDGSATWRGPFGITFRSARELHRVRLASPLPVWSLFVKFKRTRRWGFVRNGDLGWEMAGHAPSSYEFKGRFLPRPSDPFREQVVNQPKEEVDV